MNIDYGRGQTNIDTSNGIRFGVISQHTVGNAWYEDSEADYGDPHCPKCGNAVQTVEQFDANNVDEKELEQYGHGCADYVCAHCEHTLDSSDCFGEEPRGFFYKDESYQLVSCLDSDIMVLKSPYYTRALFCSPCVPGAGNLDSPDDDGAKAYCLGHDWFENEKAPYRVFRVDTDEEVLPESR